MGEEEMKGKTEIEGGFEPSSPAYSLFPRLKLRVH